MENQLQYNLWLKYDSETKVIENTLGEDGEYSGYYEDRRSFRPISLHMSKPKSGIQETILSAVEPVVNMPVWMVVVRYTDGGTFGCTHGYWQSYGVFKNADSAQVVADQIKNKTYPPLSYTSSSGRTSIGYHPWEGHFCGLDDVEVHRMVIDP